MSENKKSETFEPQDEFKEYLDEWMVALDSEFISQSVPIKSRVMMAAHSFVEDCILDVRGDTKEDYLTKPWFRAIHGHVKKWYEEKYGDSLSFKAKFILGVSEIHGIPFQLQVPVHLKRKSEEKDTFLLIFPVDVQPEENPEEWVVSPPNFKALSTTERSEVRKKIENVGVCLRQIGCDLGTAETSDENSSKLASTILIHLISSAEHLSSRHNPSLGLACWESHQAVEKVLKLLDRQQRQAHSKSHDLGSLYRKVESLVPTVDKAELALIPESGRIIEMRSGEGDSVSLALALSVYGAAVSIVHKVADALERRVRMRNSELKLKKPPWV